MRAAAVSVFLFLNNCDVGIAQETTGGIIGRVVAQDGSPLADVEVVAGSPVLLGPREGVTTTRGSFSLLTLPPGPYSVWIRRVGYRPVRFEQVPVRLGTTTTLGDIQLQLQTIVLPELVISAEGAVLDPTSAAAGTTLPATTFEALPTERSYLSIATIAPQANVSYIGDGPNISGATGLENAYFIDGVNVTDPHLANRATNLPYNFVQEVQLKTGGFEAEYGRALGGIVNVVTPSGGNQLTGQAFGFYTGSGLAGARRAGLLDADVSGGSEFDVGLSVGGALKRDRAWFFGAYNKARLSEDVTIPGFGLQEAQRRSDLFAGKLTWQPQAQTTLVLSAFGDPTTRRVIGPFTTALGTPASLDNIDPFLGNFRSGGLNISVQGRHQADRRVLLEATLSRLSRHDKEEGATERGRTEPLYLDLSTGRWSGGFGHVRDWRSRRTAARVVGTVLLATHSIKVGAEYENNRLDQAWRVTEPGITGIVLVPAGPVTDWRALYLNAVGRVRNRLLSFFVQDSWLAAAWLRLNYGLRWDGQYLVGSDGRTAQTITGQLQPRLGIVTHWGLETLSASYARYYEQLPTGFAVRHYIPTRNGFYLYDQDPALGSSPRDSFDFTAPVTAEVPGLSGQYIDEWSVGYAREVAKAVKVGVRGVYRTLGEAISHGHPDVSSPGGFMGNPGRGALDFLPPFKRRYTAIELTLGGRMSRGVELSAAYVLSRSWGNYPGLYDSDIEGENPNAPQSSGFPEQVPNSWGPLPNDRPHVFKLFGSAQLTRQFQLGVFATWQSGTPLNELGALPNLPASDVFLSARGSAGRAPSLWDLNFRSTYALPPAGSVASRIVLDVFHVGSPRRAVSFDQVHYQDADPSGNQILPNPNYLRPTRYQPPMSARLGLLADF
jgi:hypothetical protein